jgi:hypothetical protein
MYRFGNNQYKLLLVPVTAVLIATVVWNNGYVAIGL